MRFHKLAYTDQTERVAKGIGRHLPLLLLWLQVSNSSLEVGLDPAAPGCGDLTKRLTLFHFRTPFGSGSAGTNTRQQTCTEKQDTGARAAISAGFQVGLNRLGLLSAIKLKVFHMVAELGHMLVIRLNFQACLPPS